jgi:hypothetical protein
MTAARVLGATLALGLMVAPPARAVPKATETSYYYDNFENSFVRPITRVFDPALGVRKLTRNPREAANVDANDQVQQPSTWWQPRLGFQEISPERAALGPGPAAGPAKGKYTVTRGKTQGVTPGFFIKDAAGVRWILKFDPLANPEMATGAGVIAARLFWAAGYNVPDDVIVDFRETDLEISKDATLVDRFGRKRALTQADVSAILERVPRNADGSFRALASRLLTGTVLGPFRYNGRRKDDPEDLIPHELRRELRGLWTLAAWTNHADVRGPNSLDVWVKEGGREFVRHHLIDFNGCLGSGSFTARSYPTGGEYFIDYGVMATSLVTLGLKPFAWEKVHDPKIPALGFIEADAFDPEGWRPDYPNPAFDERTERDMRWGAKILAGFSDAHIRAAVEQAKFSDPRATDEMTRVLIARRDKLVRRWLGAATPVTNR